MPSVPSHDTPIRWGFLGAGWIADRVCDDVTRTPGNVVTAVAARDAVRAAAFADRHGAARSYGSYQDLVEDDQVDVVHIATTHPGHREHALMAIAAGKAVLIEKPVAMNAAQAREIFAAAATAGVFSMEAMWMRANPLFRRARQLVADGVIGDVVGLRAEFGVGLPYDPAHRLYDLANGGGALLDAGIYPITMAYVFLGRPDEVSLDGMLSPAGADETVMMTWSYGGVPKAQLFCSASAKVPNGAVVHGTEGWITFAPPFFRPTGLTVHAGGEEYTIEDPLVGPGTGYGPQIQEVERCLRAGLLQSPLVPPADTFAVLELIDDARAVLGVRYPSE